MSLDAELEVAVHLHNFHNLDLFQQGWYAIKVTCFWDSPLNLAGIPSRVVQYEAPDIKNGEANTFWRIDDLENSYTSRLMRIRYARQDCALQEMVSFHLPVIYSAPQDSSLIIKFDLMFAPRDKTAMIEPVPDEIKSVSSHSFQVVSRYWHCLHSYVPVTFDSSHFVQLDVNVHTVLLSFSPKLLLPLSNRQDDEGRQKTKPGSEKNDENVSKSNESENPTKFSNLENNNLILNEQKKDELVSERNSSMAKEDKRPTLTLEDFRLLRLLESSRKILTKKLLTFFIQLGLETSFAILDSEPEVVEAKLAAMVAQIPRGNADKARDPGKTNSNDVNFLSIPRGGSISYNILDSSSTLNELYRNVYFKMGLDEYMGQRKELTSQVASLWNIFLGFHRLHHSRLCRLLRLAWESRRSKEASLFAIEENIAELDDFFGLEGGNWLNDWRNSRAHLQKKSHEERALFSSTRANLYREGLKQAKFEESPLLDLQIFGDPGSKPILFLERHVSKSELANLSEVQSQLSSQPYPDDNSDKEAINSYLKLINLQKRREGKHVVVFVHGFHGNHQDLRVVRNHWLLLDPDIECIMSDVNEDRTSDSFAEMGHRLAMEVSGILINMFGLKSQADTQTQYQSNSLPRSKLRHLSFVGFSIGNLIIRAALADDLLKPFLKHLYTYVSLSAPHLGYLYSSNSILNSGLWVLKRLKNDVVMHQLTFTDQSDIKDCYLYQLSQTKSLDHFQHIILLSSPQDGYVPYHSARLELCQAAIKDPKRGPAYTSMVQGCLGGFAEAPCMFGKKTLVRVDVNFDTAVQAKNVDSVIGRAAHVLFLENDVYVRLWMWTLRDCFL